MKNPQPDLVEKKFSAMVMSAPVGVLEIDSDGNIVFINEAARLLIHPLADLVKANKNNFHDLLRCIGPRILAQLRAWRDNEGLIYNDVHRFSLPLGEESMDRAMKMTIHKQYEGCYIVACEDLTEKMEKEKAAQEAAIERAVIEGKCEMAADVLHDIGNAIVGFGSYITRIRRATDNATSKNLVNLAGFFKEQQSSLAQAIGDNKSAAVIHLLEGLVTAHNNSQEDIQKSVNELLSILSHIQELLNFQRQYVAGRENKERKGVNIRSILADCLAMQHASMDRRGIQVQTEFTAESTVISGDRTRLMQVVMNILKNSIEAIDARALNAGASDAGASNAGVSDAGASNAGASQKIIRMSLTQANQLLTLRIRDSGVGFGVDVADQLFSRGFTTKPSGTGLGLANCRSILQSHSATITTESEGPGKGATTTIAFKL